MLIINDCVDICLVVDVVGVYIGDDELLVVFVWKLVGFIKIVGVLVKMVVWGVEVENEGVDYLGVGVIFFIMIKDSLLIFL